MFIGFTPLFGVKTLLSLASAYLLRCSKLAAVISVTLHDIVLPFMPVLLTMEYTIGYWLIHHQMPTRLLAKNIRLAEMLKWTTFLEVGRPLLIGSLFVSAPAALITYAVMLPLLKRREAHRLAREADGHPPEPEQ